MRQFHLPPPDEECINEIRAAINRWITQRAAHGQPNADKIQWNMNYHLSVFWPSDIMGTRDNDSIGGVTTEVAKPPPKRQKRVIHTNKELRQLEKAQDWKRKMAASPPAEEPRFPDTFRYREREQ